MTTQPFQSRNGETLLKPVLTEEEYRSFQNDYAGFCLACGETAYNVEPDARRYVCESCSAQSVRLRGVALDELDRLAVGAI